MEKETIPFPGSFLTLLSADSNIRGLERREVTPEGRLEVVVSSQGVFQEGANDPTDNNLERHGSSSGACSTLVMILSVFVYLFLCWTQGLGKYLPSLRQLAVTVRVPAFKTCTPGFSVFPLSLLLPNFRPTFFLSSLTRSLRPLLLTLLASHRTYFQVPAAKSWDHDTAPSRCRRPPERPGQQQPRWNVWV
jgi:hypothetical protein